jgi:hypothetical protein
MAGSSNETFAPSDCTYGVGNIKVEEDMDMREEREVNVKTEKDIGSGAEESIDIKDEDGIYSEWEKGEVEDICTKEEEEVDVKEEVSERVWHKNLWI